MHIAIDTAVAPAAIELVEPDSFDRFAVVLARDDAATPELVGRIGQLDRDHVWVRPDAVLELAGPRAEDAAWLQRFDAMLAFARSKGWVDDAGRVRAHIERS